MKPLCLLTLLCAANAVAQGTIYFDWRGNSGLFQASVQVPYSIPGPPVPGDFPTNFTAVMEATALCEDPFGNWFSATNCEVSAIGWITPAVTMEWAIVMEQPMNPGWQLILSYSEYANPSYIDEFFPGVGDHVERGYWQGNHVIPEPGVGPLFLAGFLAWWSLRRGLRRA
jgi:hypothetical protein